MKIINLPCCELPKLSPRIVKKVEEGVLSALCRKCKKSKTVSIEEGVEDEYSEDII